MVMLLTVFTAMIRFGHIYPDSVYYIQYIDNIRLGLAPVAAPYCYRFLLPVLVSLFPVIDTVTVFSALSVILSATVSGVIFVICRYASFDEHVSFGTALVMGVSFPVAYYGGVPLMEAGAMAFSALAIYFTIRQNGFAAQTFLILGVMTKETAIFTGFFILFLIGVKWRNVIRVVVYPIAMYLFIRLLFANLGYASYMWTFTLSNITENLWFVIASTGATFIVVGPLAVIGFYSAMKYLREYGSDEANQCAVSFGWFVTGLMSFVPLALIGLFMAYFDARFLWPLYFALILIVAEGLDFVEKKVEDWKARQYRDNGLCSGTVGSTSSTEEQPT